MKPPTPLRSWRFALITLASIAGVLAGLCLARWQLSRAADKEALYQARLSQQQRPVLTQTDWLARMRQGTAAASLHRLVHLQGHWLGDDTVYLDNRQMNGRPGFFVLTPLVLETEGGHATVLVQRGWVPRDFEDRRRLPPVATPEGEVSMTARVATEPAHLLELGAAAPEPGFSRIRQNLDLALYRQQTGLDLLPGSVVQVDPASEGLLRDWFEPGADTAKHYGYAFQWFGLSGLIAFLYVWFQIVRRKTHTAGR
ncbi:MAG: SURF1 family protein [Curvibacter sp.]|nr:SURF1 family protein [Curvibacter sp.]